ncbi:MAG TPA: ATP-dependent DNA helicase RecG [Nitrospiria bacterium]|nr:ATP-dependent DNA helicase RecG [Nitrospiria bacterium]
MEETVIGESLGRFLQQIDRPLHYAVRISDGRRPRVQGLGHFIHARVAQLGVSVTPETRRLLRRLARLFQDYDQLGEALQRQRLDVALSIVAALKETAGRSKPPSPAGSEEGLVSLTLPLEHLPGVGRTRAALFRRLGVTTVEEFLTMLPWRYEDRSRLSAVSHLTAEQEQSVLIEVKAVGSGRAGRRRLSIVELIGDDGTGLLSAKWFNQPYLERCFRPGQRVILTGRPRTNPYGGPRYRMESPQYEVIDRRGDELIHTGRIVPVYHETKGLSSRAIRALMRRALDRYGELWPDLLPDWIRREHRLVSAARAIEEVHFPPADTSMTRLQSGQSAAQRRLIFEELLLLAVGLASRKRDIQGEAVPARFSTEGALQRRFIESLGFPLTAAQRRVIAQIEADLARTHPMNRLVQGDVGCGKTVVAVAAMMMACDQGRQAAFMAPTEILAEQHASTVRRWLEPLGVRVVTLTGGVRGADRRAATAAIRDGGAGVVVGTHALITAGIRFDRLGLVVIDEQHRFGVLQRAGLAGKGRRPDVLVMTATPIPRTLALTLYGDLDVSVIDEMPPGRRPVETRLLSESRRSDAVRLLERELTAGRQAYVVAPLVEATETSDVKAATQLADSLQRQFSRMTVGVLHGRMKPAVKDRVMREFAAGAVHVLVTTSVVEVGIDVPNATVMMIEHAERFGLAQLHQLRGRVGRGRHHSYCLLMAGGAAAGAEVRARLEAVVRSRDGFQIAEADLSFRGPGEFFGMRQSGLPELRVAHLIRDAGVLDEARSCAERLLREDPTLSAPAQHRLRGALERRWAGRLSLMTVG